MSGIRPAIRAMRRSRRANCRSTESLKDTVARFLPYWHETIAPAIRSGKRVLIAAHGNSLRALVKYLDHISDQDIVELNIPTGIPLVYELDDDLKSLGSRYLGDPEAARKAAEAVATAVTGDAIGHGRGRRARPATGNWLKTFPPTRACESGGPIGLLDLGIVCGNPERAQEAAIVGGHFDRLPRRQRARRRPRRWPAPQPPCPALRVTKPTTASSVTFIS